MLRPSAPDFIGHCSISLTQCLQALTLTHQVSQDNNVRLLNDVCSTPPLGYRSMMSSDGTDSIG